MQAAYRQQIQEKSKAGELFINKEVDRPKPGNIHV